MQGTSTQRKAYEFDERPRGQVLAFLECHGAFHKTGRAATHRSNRGDVQFGLTRDLAVGGARRPIRPSSEHSLIFGEVNHNADTDVVAGRIEVKWETAEGPVPWLKAEERFFMNFIIILLKLQNARQGRVWRLHKVK
ncbi:hypothetical protein MOQ_008781 [Trypanosoma cruzi marinkellei]|uniref:Trans-sialidase n=1 Tax=Trypanosoma cruzi marinkellei TaxID=85056 RepID=K2LXV6_TRYCR|nr:hypothetical protein MOQ_008781 [Trypanosoma cruzi marinkellei]